MAKFAGRPGGVVRRRDVRLSGELAWGGPLVRATRGGTDVRDNGAIKVGDVVLKIKAQNPDLVIPANYYNE